MKLLFRRLILPVLCILVSCQVHAQPAGASLPPFVTAPGKPLQISGVYPHLAVFNEGGGAKCAGDGSEGGIGAVTPWAGKLWMITYSPHCPNGSSDKLYSIDEGLNLYAHPESVGGTPANRMIHRESNQLITGSYFIDSTGNIRTVPLTVMPGRMTATARHLSDPANKVYFYDMEGMLYEVNVHTLAVNKLFNKPVPGWHGKGGYTAQKQLIIANNGEHKVFDIKSTDLQVGGAPVSKEDMGVLASWDGKTWKIIERKQFTDVTGPGGIYGAPDDAAPAWSIGWDKRSVILKLLDGGQWFTYRLPKATHTYDHWGGWYTEWPRIREIGNNKMLMDMHGMFYDFPRNFSYAHHGGLFPISTHLRYIPDFCHWNGQLVLATDETTILENPYAGRSQSNLWFGTPADLQQWGAPNAWGGVWIKDTVKSGVASDAFLINGFAKKVLHLSHEAGEAVTFTIETDKDGTNNWQAYTTVTVPAHGYRYYIFPTGAEAGWVRVKPNRNCIASAFFHFSATAHEQPAGLFNTLAGIDEPGEIQASFIRPAAHNKNLQVLQSKANGAHTYTEVNESLTFIPAVTDSLQKLQQILTVKRDFETDDASVIIHDKTGSFRLPKTSAAYDNPFAAGWPRGIRELESERFMLNAHGTLYEVGRESGYIAIRPITTHKKKMVDYCTWRGLLVISGTKNNAQPDGHYFQDAAHTNGLWFGAIDDLWKLGKPVGEGGLWKNAIVKANTPSLPFLMTGYDKKSISLTADQDLTVTLEVNTDLSGWHTYKEIKVPAGKTIQHVFPDGFSAHWIRAKTNRNGKVTAWLKYE
ncbi:hypothetical protein D3H65_07840 [Paraflavitalea soli]|uniref:Uncharacterized protein n=1 Tax=Paraflavitalea soli TaxID=2315862 RepID=A0A3B7MLR0_9BACT|nr:hypothetical protein [Paraflavitalea soli]AXY73896.1 hypothetical protein D3H65_07840 [Paraflavitalea soli]